MCQFSTHFAKKKEAAHCFELFVLWACTGMRLAMLTSEIVSNLLAI